jgi:hypothetical protein
MHHAVYVGHLDHANASCFDRVPPAGPGMREPISVIDIQHRPRKDGMDLIQRRDVKVSCWVLIYRETAWVPPILDAEYYQI